MAQHKVDSFGRSTDHTFRQLEDHLAVLAGIFRGAKDNSKIREATVKEYQATLQKLYDSGWDGSLDIQSELPSQFMPTRYMKCNPRKNPFVYDHARAARHLEKLQNTNLSENAANVYRFILHTLEHSTQPPTVREIAHACYISSYNATRLLDDLELQGYILRVHGKGRTISLTDKKPQL